MLDLARMNSFNNATGWAGGTYKPAAGEGTSAPLSIDQAMACAAP